MKPTPRIAEKRFYSVADFDREFANDDACLEYIKEQRWPNGVTKCEKCSIERKHHHVTQDLVLRHILNGFHKQQLVRQADSARNRRYVQDGMAHAPSDSTIADQRGPASGAADDGNGQWRRIWVARGGDRRTLSPPQSESSGLRRMRIAADRIGETASIWHSI